MVQHFQRNARRYVTLAFLVAGWEATGALLVPVALWTFYGVTLAVQWARKRRWATVAAGQPAPTTRALVRAFYTDRKRLSHLARQWRVACTIQRLTAGTDKIVPRLYDVTPTLDGDVTARIASGRIGVSVDDVQKHAPRVAEVIGCREVVVTRTAPGCAALTFYWSDPIGRVLPVAELPVSKPGLVSYGIRRDGAPATVRQDLSVLIGGLTGSGKSSCCWAMLADLVRSGVPVDLYVSDPKGGIELAPLGRHVGEQMGNLRVRQYVTTAADTLKMVEDIERAMRSRQRTQQGKGLTPSRDNPLVVTILDELLPLHEMIRQGTKSKLGQVLFEGRASLYVVWANSQVGHASELGALRNLIPQRLSFATPTAETTDTILGTGAEARGAKCSRLEDVGVGFAASDDTRTVEKFRAAYVRAEDMDRIAAGVAPEGMTRKTPAQARRCALYRAYNAEDELLYIGITDNPRRRFAEHKRDESWWAEEVDEAAIEVTWRQDEATARAEEQQAIKDELPRYNTTHNAANPLAVAWRKFAGTAS